MADHEFPSSPIYYSSSLLYDKKKTSKSTRVWSTQIMYMKHTLPYLTMDILTLLLLTPKYDYTMYDYTLYEYYYPLDK